MSDAGGGEELSAEDVAEEREAGRRGGSIALAAVAASVAALVVASSASSGNAGQPGTVPGEASGAEAKQQLIDFATSTGAQAATAGLRSASILLTIPVGLYLFWLVTKRGARVPRWARWSLFGGSVLLVLATIFGYFAFKDVADTYVASGAQTIERAKDLRESSDTLTGAVVFELAARVIFAVWVGVASMRAMNAGLLTSFLGYWGVAGAACYALTVPIGYAMYLSWLFSIALLALGYWPGGRPEAWDRKPRFEGPAT